MSDAKLYLEPYGKKAKNAVVSLANSPESQRNDALKYQYLEIVCPPKQRQRKNPEEIALFQNDFCVANDLVIPDSFFPNSIGIDEFIEECTITSEKNTKAKDIYFKYLEWCKEKGIMAKQKGAFFFELKTKGLFANSGTIDGKTYRNVVKGVELK